MTDNELSWFYRLNRFCAEKNYYVCPQICLISFIDKTNANYSGLWKIVDFVLIDYNGNVICAIEINDRSHTRPDRIERDRMVKQILNEAKIQLVTFHSLDSEEMINIKLNFLK